MMDEMHYWFQGLGYKDKFGLGEVPPAKVRKRKIEIHTILSEDTLEEMREIFVENRVSILFYNV